MKAYLAARQRIDTQEHIIRAATRARDIMLARIDANPEDPLVIHMQVIVEHAQALINNNESRD